MQPFRSQATLVFAMLSLAGAQSALAESPSFHHHHQGEAGEEQDHYKDTGDKPARAQVGRTLFESRALLDKNGITELEVTTGTLRAFDAGTTPPGYLSEVHVKAFRLDGAHQFEKEFEHLRRGGGHAMFSFPLPVRAQRRGDDDEGSKKDTRLEHGQVLKLKVEGKGLLSGEEGEAEAKLESTVKYRPDLSVSSLQYPGVARTKTAVDISASIVELMRDTGAHADCVLSVDGAQVDQAPGIWVDANGAVTCHFVQSFGTEGKHTLTVAVKNVQPREYDADNNVLSGTIEIKNPSVMAYFSSATEYANSSLYVRDVYASPTSTIPDQHYSSSSSMRTQSRTLTGTIPAAVNLPIKKATYADQSDGNALSSLAFSNLAADATTPMADPTYDAVSTIARYDGPTGAWFTLRRYSNASTGAGVTNVSFNFYGGEATYHSEAYCKSVAGVFTCSGGDYSPNPTTSVTTSGSPIVNLGRTYGADVLVDDGTAYQAHPSMTLVSTANRSAAPLACRDMTLGGAPCRVCIQSTATSSVTSGSAAFTPPQ